MKGAEIREAFLSFFESKGHTRVGSSSVIPEGDATLLFTNAGMNQFKDCFLGAEKRNYTRATTCQKCVRISGKHNDLENVGVTARHHTLFEMLGNFSFGDYFKEDAIKYAWEFVTETMKMPKDRLWVTVFEEDDEAAGLWKELTDVNSDRILKMGEKDNFWSMGDTGPCGPCSEIFFYIGDDVEGQSEKEFRKDDGTYLEFWNLVFMQFDRGADGTMNPLPKPSVDTGMGLERMAMILQGKTATYDADLLRSIIAEAERLSGFAYDGSSYEVRDLKKDVSYARDVAMRVIADHSRAITYLIADGVYPGSEGRGYVLRRLIRRAVRHGRVLNFKNPFLAETTSKVVEIMAGAYPELLERKDSIVKIADAEERKFHETIDAGLVVLQKEVKKVKKGKLFAGETAFLLHDTYGFPLDLTQDALKADGIEVDVTAFEAAMTAQKERSREDRKSQKIEFSSVNIDAKATEFLGYNELKAEAKVSAIISACEGKKTFAAGEELSLLFDATPFYAESGGQVGDSGLIRIGDAELSVLDTQKVKNQFFVHECRVENGELSADIIGASAELSVDGARRNKISAHHSATHLVHAALQEVLGDHVKQAGSRVDDRSLRFDYSHFEPVTAEQLVEIQTFVNDQIRSNHEVSTRVMPIDEAKAAGATALFGEKYGDTVRVVEIGPESLELCGGVHVTRSGDIGFLILQSETGVSAGVRRIECLGGAIAHEELLRTQAERNSIGAILKSDASELPAKVERLVSKNRVLEKELEQASAKIASSKSGDLVSTARTSPNGIKVIAESVEGADTNTLRGMVDSLRVKLGSGVVALASSQGDSGILVAGVTSDLASTLHAGSLVKEAVKETGGRGGGRADFAQAGGVDPTKLGDALDKFFGLVN